MAERIYSLSRLIPVEGVAGRARPATGDDVDLLAAWFDAFNTEAHPDDVEVTPEGYRERAAWSVSGGSRLMMLWEDEGGVVSMAGSAGPTPNGIRVGPVYTPPDKRGRGYASACTAELSRARLEQGYRFCFLFTDLSNPVSNSIYRRMGYEPVCDVDVYRFV
jgi:predicted GNAT family acetyltransferase